MSTGPGPTRKADGSHNASADNVSHHPAKDEVLQENVDSEQILDDGLDVMLETPGPVLVNSFLPPPPSPTPGAPEEEGDSAEEPESSTNLAYEDLLAKLVLPSKASEPEPPMSVPVSPLPLPDPIPAVEPVRRSSSPNFLVAPPTDERTLVTENPLLAEEQEAAVREGRTGSRDVPHVIHEEMRAALTEPVSSGAANSKLLYLMLGGLLVLGCMILGVLVLKLFMPTPAPPPPIVIRPTVLPPPAPPTHVEPLPPTEVVAPAAPAQAPAAAPPAPAEAESNPPPAAPEEAVAPEPAQPKVHKSLARPKIPRSAVAKPAVAAKPATPAKVEKPAEKPAKEKKAGKSGGHGWVDPFDN
jgi:hypothetical protein